jgi:hypothetical protein
MLAQPLAKGKVVSLPYYAVRHALLAKPAGNRV